MINSATANPILTSAAVKLLQNPAGFVGMALAPVFRTAEQSAQYYVLNEENLLNTPRNIRRAPSADYSRGRTKLSDDSYSCNEYGHEEPVDDRERKKYASYLDADLAATRRCTNVIKLNHEIRVKDLAVSGAVPSASPSTKWDADGSDPVGDVDAAKTNIHKNTGMEATLMVVNRDVFYVLKEHPQVIEKIKYSQRGVVTPEILATVFGVERFLVAGSLTNSAQEGQTISPSYIWGDSVIVAHVNDQQDLMAPNFMRTFAWVQETGPDGVLVESYRDEKQRSDVHRARHDVDEKIVGAKAGYHLSSTLT